MLELYEPLDVIGAGSFGIIVSASPLPYIAI